MKTTTNNTTFDNKCRRNHDFSYIRHQKSYVWLDNKTNIFYDSKGIKIDKPFEY